MQLQFKGQVVHSKELWDARPVEPHLFVYAYEDVTYRVYTALTKALKEAGLYGLCLALSQQRGPPVALSPLHPS